MLMVPLPLFLEAYVCALAMGRRRRFAGFLLALKSLANSSNDTLSSTSFSKPSNTHVRHGEEKVSREFEIGSIATYSARLTYM